MCEAINVGIKIVFKRTKHRNDDFCETIPQRNFFSAHKIFDFIG